VVRRNVHERIDPTAHRLIDAPEEASAQIAASASTPRSGWAVQPNQLVHHHHHRGDVLDPIKALFWSAVLNGVVAAPLMVMIMLMARQRRVMGAFAGSWAPLSYRARYGR
jgi:hypothetical protein